MGNNKLEVLASQQVSFLTRVFRTASGFMVRTDIEKSQARYQRKLQQQAKSRLVSDVLNTLPVEEKLRLGMYRFMD
jgi:hypothetical protein